MVSLAIREYPSFRLEDYEIKRSGVSCSYETMEHLTKLYPKDSFYFIIGADSLFAIETWRSPERLFATCTILAAFRGDKNSRAIMNGRSEGLDGNMTQISGFWIHLSWMFLLMNSADGYVRERM